jgi:hypothetical protein
MITQNAAKYIPVESIQGINTVANRQAELFRQKKLNNGMVVFDFDIQDIIEAMESLVMSLSNTELT